MLFPSNETELSTPPSASQSDLDSLSSAHSSIAEAVDRRNPSPIASASSPSRRRSVLFTAPETFSSSASFFAACRERLLGVYGISSHIRRHGNKLAEVGRSERTENSQCRFAVRADLEEGRWVVKTDECIWEHTHDRVGARVSLDYEEEGGDSAMEDEGVQKDEDEETSDSGGSFSSLLLRRSAY